MTGLPAGLLATWLAQTLGLPMKAVRGWRQTAVVAIFLQTLLQGLHLLLEQVGLFLLSLNQVLLLVDHRLLHVNCLLLQTGSFPQRLILFSQVDQFFFCCHGPTVLGSGLQDESCSTPDWLPSSLELKSPFIWGSKLPQMKADHPNNCTNFAINPNIYRSAQHIS
jgi:hypothetical protein